MSFDYNKKQHYKTIKDTCYTANIVYLILRVIYLVLFIITKLYVLMWIDLASILIYLLCFILLKKKKYYIYALVCGNEFLAFVVVTTIMLGFNTGFHFYIIGLCVVSFFTSYFSKKNNIRNALIWAAMSVVIYLVIYFITRYNNPVFTIDRWLEVTLFTIHAVTVFLFVAYYLLVFLKYTLSLEKKIMNESRTDELTQISNRYGLYDYYFQENRKFNVLALFDIDDFKKINDVYGHVTGDYILKRVAQITTYTLKDAFVCRYGGEEFVVVLDQNNFLTKLEELRNNIANEVFEFNNNKIHITITIGAIESSKNMSLEEWVELADEKMYTGKNSGKNKTVI